MALPANALCTLADLKDELGIVGLAEDPRLERLIGACTNAIERYCGRPSFHYEAARVEDVKGLGSVLMHLGKVPLRSIASVVFDPSGDNETITASLYHIDDAEIGSLYREDGWLWTASQTSYLVDTPLPGTEERLYRVTYACGYITKNMAAATSGLFPPATVTITRSGSVATVAHTAHGLATGDSVAIAGATQGQYNGVFVITVTGANSYTYTVPGSPATPATGTIIATTQQTLPFDLEDACLQLAAMRYRWAARNPGIVSERLLSWGASYNSDMGAGGIIPESIAAVLDGYKRVVTA